MATLTAHQLPLAPLGAVDLIDRAVRLYRRHFMTLIRIAAPPVVISAIGSVLWGVGVRELWATTSELRLALYFALAAVGAVLLIGGNLLNLIVMGGATRNLVTHLLWNEPVSARTTYRAVRARFWGLLGATVLVGLVIMVLLIMIMYAWLVAIGIVFALATMTSLALPAWIPATAGIVASTVVTYGALWLFFLAAGRFAYVPQVMMVEGKGVFAAINRSSMLARGNVRRLMAMALFNTFAAYSALMLLVIPLGWYGYLNGINPSPWDYANWPAWYAIGYNVLAQSSSILLAPAWMLGLSLLYVDERVRHEGYDVELMAARRLGEIPRLTGGMIVPLAPAIAAEQVVTPPPAPPRHRSSNSVLGLQ